MFIEAATDLLRLHISTSDWARVNITKAKIEQLIKNSSNSYLVGSFLRHKSLSLRCIGQSTESKLLADESIATIEKTGSMWLQSIIYRDQGVNLFMSGNENAEILIRRSKSIEALMRPNLRLSRSFMMSTFLEARSSYTQSIQKLLRIKKANNAKVEENLLDYFVGTIMYLYGPSVAERAEGLSILKRTEACGSYPWIKVSAHETIATKKLHSFI
jgi:hypothetical protein